MIVDPTNAMLVRFLRKIGIECTFEEGASGFLEQIEIRHGKLFIQPKCFSGHILHEAGHIAITPSRWRHLLHGDVKYAQTKMFEELQEMRLHPDHPLERAMLQNSDPEVTAWAWAIGHHLELSSQQIIDHTRSKNYYAGAGPQIAMMLEARAYIGIHGLSHAGFCCPRVSLAGKPVYPKLEFWLQH
jgi:hypothetical protein